jgi:putative transcriptional regulator
LAALIDVTCQTVNASEKQRYDPGLSLAFKTGRIFECRIEDVFCNND